MVTPPPPPLPPLDPSDFPSPPRRRRRARRGGLSGGERHERNEPVHSFDDDDDMTKKEYRTVDDGPVVGSKRSFSTIEGSPKALQTTFDEDDEPVMSDELNDDVELGEKPSALVLTKEQTDKWLKKAEKARNNHRPSAKLVAKRTLWVEEANSRGNSSSNDTYPSPTEVLAKLLQGMRSHDSDKYGSYIQSKPHLMTELKGFLRPEALKVFESRDYCRDQ